MRYSDLFAFTAAAVLSVSLFSGCAGGREQPASTGAEVAGEADAPKEAPPVDLAEVRPNEAGQVPILEYHDITEQESRWGRSRERFRSDLERLYKEGYRPISIQDYLANRIDIPAGTSPVIITFDDSVKNQFYFEDGRPSPNSAVGIMEAFTGENPEFRTRGVFYILPESAFGASSDRKKKLEYLLEKGFEIGNHTVAHGNLGKLSEAEVQKEIGGAVKLIRDMTPDAEVDTIALPFGASPKNAALLKSGTFSGQSYTNRAALLVGANPAPSPVSAKFNPMRLPRIQAIEGDFGITYWLDHLQNDPGKRYVSDGDPETVTVPRDSREEVDDAKLQGARLRVYNPDTGEELAE